VTRIACVQLAPQLLDLPANHALTVAAIRDAVRAGADVVVLPELATSGYVFASADEAAAVAIGPEHALLADWAAEAARGDAVVVGGFCERGDDGRLHNSAAIVDGSGVLGVYRKTHLWDREKLVFAPGDTPPRVYDTRAGRIGVLVCYDLEFPELTRLLALEGAELIAVPTNWPLMDRPAGERPAEVQIGMAAARVNRVFIACCDRTGTERGQAWTAGTSVIDESGWVVATPGEEGAAGAAIADVDLARARDKQLTSLCDALGDRRPELYGALAATPAAPGSNRGPDPDGPRELAHPHGKPAERPAAA
jgi:5-aminopentanamidase